MQHALGLVGQAAVDFARQLAQEAKHAPDSKHAAKLAAHKAQHAHAVAQAAKAKAAAAALEEGNGAENLVTGAAVSLKL